MSMDDLIDPDGGSDTSYAWDEQFQRHIISLLLCDRQFLLQSLDLIKPSYFTNRSHQKVCSVLFSYFRKYRVLPKKDFIIQEVKTDLKENKALPAYLAEINVIFDYFQPGLDSRDYLTAKIQYFAKMQAFRKAFHDGLKLLDDNPESDDNWQKIYDKIETVITTSANFEIGLNYFESVRDRYVKMAEDDENRDRFITGLQSIDMFIQGGGYSRGEIISVVGNSGVGKSILLACISATNLLRGKKGLYITLELADHKVAERMDAILTGFPVQNLYNHKEEIFDKLAHLSGVDYESKMPFVIKQFPGGSASVNTIRAYISQLRFHGYDPDFMILDYIGEMADIPGVQRYESRERIVRDLRGMATEEDIFIATAMQPNRDSKKDQQGQNSRIDDQHLADAFGQIRPLDGCFSLNQNDSEKSLGIGRCYIIKQRDGKSRYQIYLNFNQQNLKITEISQVTYKNELSKHKEYANDETKIDKIISSFPAEMEPLPPLPPVGEEEMKDDEETKN